MKKLLGVLFATLITVGGFALADANFDFSVVSNAATSISGENVRFTIGMRNNTGVNCTGSIRWNLDAGFANTTVNPGPIEGQWGAFLLTPGSSRSVVVNTTVDAWTWNDTFGIDVEANYNCNGSTASTGVSAYLGREAELVVEKVVDPSSGNPHNPGDDVDYIVTITNIGSENATNFVFDDDLPANNYFIWAMNTLARFNGVQRDGIRWAGDDVWRWEGSYMNIPAGNPATTANNPMVINIHGTLDNDARLHPASTMLNRALVSGIGQFYDTNNEDSATARVENSDLYINISRIGSDPMYDQDPVVWQIDIGNIGNIDATNVRIDGTINGVYPAGSTYEFISNEVLNYAQSQNGNVVWSVLPGTVGSTTRIILTGYLNTGLVQGGDEVCFDARIAGDLLEDLIDNSANNQDLDPAHCYDVLYPIPPVDTLAFDLTLTTPKMSGDNAYAISGTQVTFDIDVTNTGNAPINGFIQCQLPATDVLALVPNSGSPIAWNWDQGDLTIEMDNNYTIPNNGNTVNFSFDAIVTDDAWTNFPITCLLYSGNINNNLLETDTERLYAIPDLVVTKTLGDNPAAPGDVVDFYITIENIGSSVAQSFNFVDQIMQEWMFNFPAHWSMTFDGQTVPYTNYGPQFGFVWEGNFLTLNPGETMTIHGQLPIDANDQIHIGDVFQNQARVGGLAREYDATNNSDTVQGMIETADLSIDITAIGASPEYMGDPIVFQIDYANNGNATGVNALLQAWITDQVVAPGGAGQYLLGSSLPWNPPVDMGNGRALSWSALAPIAPGANGTIILTGYLNSDQYLPGQPICLSGEFMSEYTETLGNLLADNTDMDCHYVTGEIADLTLTKTLLTDLSTVEEGDEVAYRIDFENIGSYGATDIVVEDYLPGFLSNAIHYLSAPNTAGSLCTTNAQNVVVCNGIDLGAGEAGYLVITGYLNLAPNAGFWMSNTGHIFFDGREFNTGNNRTGITNWLPGLPDIYVDKVVVGEEPALPGEQITYQIMYGNRGGRTASNVMIVDHLIFTGLQVVSSTPALQVWDTPTSSGHWAPFELAAGQTGVLTVVAALDDRYNSGTQLPNEVWISSDTYHINTGDEYDIVAGEVQRRQDVMVNVTANNLTHPAWDVNNPVWAVSGDVVTFTVDYINSGNVDLNGVTVTLALPAGLPGLDELYEWNIGYLPFGSGGTFVVTGVVGPQGFDDIDGVGRIWAQQFGLQPADEDVATVIEKPLRCGDGFLTADEMCDWTSTGEILGLVLPGQACRSRAGIPAYGCEVVTEYVINTGCIEYTLGSNLNQIGGYCVDVQINVEGASCESATLIEQRQVSLTGWEVDFACDGINTTNSTYITMDCGNGQYLTGFGSDLEGTCEYEGDLDQIVEYSAQCSVGNDTINPACLLDISITPPDHAMCEYLEADGSNVLVVEEDETGTLDFTCTASTGVAQTISIDCGNGTVIEDEGVSSLTAECEYTGIGEEDVYPVVCEVNGQTNDDCADIAIVTPPYLRQCGDGIREGYEQCDFENNGETIYDDLDEQELDDAGRYGDGKYYCYNCAIIPHQDATIYTPPACFNVNTNISVMEDEFLPFRWNLEMNDAETDADRGADEGDECDEEGAINTAEMECTFSLYNGHTNSQADDDPITTVTKDCFVDDWDDDQLPEFFSEKGRDFYPSLWMDDIGKNYFKMKDGDTFDDANYGEQKLVLERVEYQYCEKVIEEVEDPDTGEIDYEEHLMWSDGDVVDRVCEVNYALTKPYLMQKSSFGAIKVDEDVDLRDFYDIQDNNIVSRTDLEDIMEINADDFEGGVEVRALIDQFMNKYEKIAITIPEDQRDGLVSNQQGLEKISKVPGKQIYVFEGDGKITLNQNTDQYPGVPYTIVMKGMDLYIEGDVYTNGMFIVDGTIGFQEKDAEDFCTKPQEVQGIFITEDGFVGTEYDENEDGYIGRYDKDNQLCEYGNLIVRGVMIGDNLNDLVLSRRSHLNTWFHITDFDNADEERREKLFDGAAVLIEYNPSLWTELPPGAEDFTEALEVYKR